MEERVPSEYKTRSRAVTPFANSESHTVTKTVSQYNIKQHNNFLGKQNLLGQRNTSVIDKELNGILSGPCDGRKTLSVKQ